MGSEMVQTENSKGGGRGGKVRHPQRDGVRERERKKDKVRRRESKRAREAMDSDQ